MKHSAIEELISSYANGQLGRTQREFVDQHLPRCPSCNAALADYAWVRNKLTSLREQPTEVDIKEATMSSIGAIDTSSRSNARGRTRRPIRWVPRPALALMAVAAAIIAALVLQLPTSGPGGLIAKAHAATASLQSYRVTGSTASTFNEEYSEVTFEWEFAAPDRHRVKMTQAGEVAEFIIVGDDQYTRVSGSGQSSGTVTIITTGGYSVYNPVPSREGTLQLLDSLTDLDELPDQEIDGVNTLRFRGRVDIDRIMDEQRSNLDPTSPAYQQSLDFLELQRSTRIDVELWISKEDDTVRKMQLDGRFPITGSGGQQTGWSSHSTSVRFYDLNEPIEIEQPLTATGELLPGWDLVDTGPPAPQIQEEVRSDGQ